ncbi:MAG: ABC transporter permease, partial [Rhodobacterales bacterium]
MFTQVSRQPVSFVLSVMGLLGALVGLFFGPTFGSAFIGIVLGTAVSVIIAYGILATDKLSRKAVRALLPVLLAVLGM